MNSHLIRGFRSAAAGMVSALIICAPAFAATVDASATVGNALAVPQANLVPTPSSQAPNTPVAMSPQAAEVLKLANAGVSDDVIKAYIANSQYIFNLTPDAIIYMQQHGVSGSLSAEMLNHDKAVRDRGNQAVPYAVPQPQQPVTQVTPPATTDATGPSVDAGYGTTPPSEYTGLSPYGNWTYQDGYGWGWQPYSGIDYSGFAILGFGGWGFWPGRGWCWSPRGYGYYGGYGYRGYAGYGGYRSYGGYGRNGYAGYRGGYSGFGGTYRGGGYSRGGVTTGGGFIGSGGSSHSSGGFSGGGHSGGFSGGGGSHGGGGGHR